MTLLYRPHRELLADAMKEVKEFDGTREGLQNLIGNNFIVYEVTKYYYDDRTEWNTYIVLVIDINKNNTTPSPIGFTNGPLICKPKPQSKI